MTKLLATLISLAVLETGAGVFYAVQDIKWSEHVPSVVREKIDSDVVCIGDSVTFGWKLPPEETFPNMIGAANYGMPGATIQQVMEIYITEVAHLKPKTVVVMAGWNNISGEYIPQPIRTTRYTLNSVRLVEHAYRMGKKLVTEGITKEQRNLTIIRRRETQANEIYSDKLVDYWKHLNALVTLIRVNGSEPILLTLPHMSELTDRDKHIMLPQLWKWDAIGFDGWHTLAHSINLMVRSVGKIHNVHTGEGHNGVLTNLDKYGKLLHAQVG